jgi:hypothetical protein
VQSCRLRDLSSVWLLQSAYTQFWYLNWEKNSWDRLAVLVRRIDPALFVQWVREWKSSAATDCPAGFPVPLSRPKLTLPTPRAQRWRAAKAEADTLRECWPEAFPVIRSLRLTSPPIEATDEFYRRSQPVHHLVTYPLERMRCGLEAELPEIPEPRRKAKVAKI